MRVTLHARWRLRQFGVGGLMRINNAYSKKDYSKEEEVISSSRGRQARRPAIVQRTGAEAGVNE